MNNKYLDSFMYSYWSNGKVFEIDGKSYTMHKMSYGDYFAQPANWKGGENDGFASGTLWFQKITNDFPSLYYKIIK